jgi:hypothetical protein
MAQEQHCSTPLLAKEFLGLEDMNPAERVTQGNTAALHGEHHDRGVKGDPRYLGPRRRVPDPRRAIAGTGDDAGAVGEKAALSTTSSWRRTLISVPVVASQIRAMRSREAVTMRAPSGEKPALSTWSSWPRRTVISVPVAAPQIRAERSQEAVRMRAPSGEKAALHTWPSCPRRTLISVPVVASQIRAVRSQEAVTMRAPSGEKAALSTKCSCPRRTLTSVPVVA